MGRLQHDRRQSIGGKHNGDACADEDNNLLVQR